MNRFDNMSKDAMARVEEIMNSTKLNEFLHRKEEEEKKKTCILCHFSRQSHIFIYICYQKRMEYKYK